MANVRLLDLDIVVYRCGFASERKLYTVAFGDDSRVFDTHRDAVEFATSQKSPCYISHEVVVEPLENALHNVNTLMKRLTENVKYEGFLTGKGNFRHKLATIKKYKGNRVDFVKPIHYDAIREHLINKWGAKVVDGQEADDEIGVRCYELRSEGADPVVVSIDKDLDMIEGMHYNWVKDAYYVVGPLQAWKSYYTQCIMGDRTDNIPGIEGIGPAGAAKILEGATSAGEMKQRALSAWMQCYPDGVATESGHVITAENAFKEVAQLLWIRRERMSDTKGG